MNKSNWRLCNTEETLRIIMSQTHPISIRDGDYRDYSEAYSESDVSKGRGVPDLSVDGSNWQLDGFRI